jgi:hypothetical protein
MEKIMSANTCSICGSPHHLALIHSNWPMNALWFPPYGNLGAQPAAPAPKAASFDDALKAHEDKVAEVIGGLGEAERAIAYKYLHAGGMRIATADHELRKAIRKELGEKQG